MKTLGNFLLTDFGIVIQAVFIGVSIYIIYPIVKALRKYISGK